MHGIGRIDVMKVDVQGHEPEVVHGAQRLLRSGAIRLMILEIDDPTLATRGMSREEMLRIVGDYDMWPASPLGAGDVAFTSAAWALARNARRSTARA
jgi:hypothetical protein